MNANIQGKKQTRRRPIMLLFALAGLAICGAIITSASIIPNALAQTTKVQKVTWNITGAMVNPLKPQSEPWIRLEDPETKIVCYTQHPDFSGGLFCAKK